MDETYIQYGVASDLAQKLKSLGLPLTTFRSTSKKNLETKYGLVKSEIDLVKDLIEREPIDKDLIEILLEKSNFTCCICKGTKSDAYVIHHIDHYSKTQDNSYQNLAVLCPNDHDLAHKEGKSLTLKLTPEQIRNLKTKWETEVENNKVYKASVNGDINEVDFLNVPRIIEACKEIFGELPETEYTKSLIQDKLIDNSGFINLGKISTIADNPNTPLIFFAPLGSTKLRYHYFELLKKLLKRLNFVDLDLLLNKQSVKEGIIGKYCYYVGGVYGQKPDSPVTKDSQMTRISFRRKPFFVEWPVDQKYFASSSTRARACHRNIYLIYGKIRNVDTIKIKDKPFIKIDIRPYAFGLPKETKHRTPDIAYQKRFDEAFDDEDE